MISLKRNNGATSPAPRTGQASARLRETDSSARSQEAKKLMSTSGMYPTGMPGTTLSNNGISIDLEPMMQGLLPSMERDSAMYPLYRDMYYNDPICGSAADLTSVIAFSDFNLGGGDKKILEKYNDTIHRLGTKTLLSEISLDYQVLGYHASSLLYNKAKRKFVDIMPHAPEDCTIETLPFYSQDPIVTVKFNDQVTSLLRKDSKRVKYLRELIGPAVFDKILTGSIELDPLTTLYIPRKTFTNTDKGVSYFRRCLPYYLIEKNLYRGTLVESAKRQRGILHLILGDGENWIPTPDDMNYMTELFMNADSDPLGAVIATQEGIQVNELRQGGEFWKVSDFADSVMNMKLRALGISESFLSGDATFSNQDSALMVFLKMLRNYRDMITRKFFYDRLFPLISLVNGYCVNAKGKIIIDESLINKLDDVDAMSMLSDGTKLFCPIVEWTKQLDSNTDPQLMEMLSGLTEKGFPPTLRMLAAASGINLDQLLQQKDDDMRMRKEFSDWIKDINALSAEAGEDEGEEGGAEESLSSGSAVGALISARSPKTRTASAIIAEGGRVPLLNREFGEAGEITGHTKTGKKKMIFGQKQAQERVNRLISRAAVEARKKIPKTQIVSRVAK